VQRLQTIKLNKNNMTGCLFIILNLRKLCNRIDFILLRWYYVYSGK